MIEATGVILVGHGSRCPGADRTLADLATKLERISGQPIYHAFLQFSRPTIRDSVARLAVGGCSKVVLLPVFIYEGQHVVQDIPELLDQLKLDYPVTFIVGEPLGPDHRLAEILNERLAALAPGDHPGPRIAQTSFRIIEGSVDLPRDPVEREIAMRVVHTTGDRSLGQALVFADGAITAGIRALSDGVSIVTDVAMVRAGISCRLLPGDNKITAAIGAAPARPGTGLTRSAAGMRAALAADPRAIIVVGNAPTALNEACRLIEGKEINPALVIGVPVGFVGAVEAKERLASQRVEYITMPGTRGGSPVAAAIVNALAVLAGRDGDASQDEGGSSGIPKTESSRI